MSDCNPQQKFDCGREFGQIGATLDLVREDLRCSRDTLEKHGAQLTQIRIAIAKSEVVAAVEEQVVPGVGLSRKAMATAIATIIAAGGIIGGAVTAMVKGQH
jgi:hypothetical protein